MNNVFPSERHKRQKGLFYRVHPQIEREIKTLKRKSNISFL